ncbi:MAG: alpha/beta hydrolase [Micromonosporaceae bacterium]
MRTDALDSEVDSRETEFASLDGLRLKGTVSFPPAQTSASVVLVHGGGVNREEGGFFKRLAHGLAGAGIASLRFDFRAHGESEGRQEDLTICGILNDIRAANAHLCEVAGTEHTDLVGASFGGGICAFFAARYPEMLRRLVLFNPLLNYKKRLVDEKPYWSADRISVEAGRELAERGFLLHNPNFKLGRPLLNEVFYVQPHRILPEVSTPTLFVHGTADTFVPIESTREAVNTMHAPASLIEIDGAQHGIAVHDDPGYLDPQTQQWQASVVRSVTEWLGQ